MVASIISLGFLVTHAHCYPFKDTSLNMLKPGLTKKQAHGLKQKRVYIIYN